MGKKNSLSTVIMVLILSAVILSGGFIGIMSYTVNRNMVVNNYAARSMAIAQTVASGINAEKMEYIMEARVIVAIAGMEGALPSVIGGLADCPVIAVPTSIGYGANFGGLSALLTMLNSCASGVCVVNIDNGFGGGYLASMINHQ